MTILCLALGNPAPTISLYVGGHLVRQDTTRHMVTVINNVTKDMEHVSCYADNGYGIPMQAAKKIHISCKPFHYMLPLYCFVIITSHSLFFNPYYNIHIHCNIYEANIYNKMFINPTRIVKIYRSKSIYQHVLFRITLKLP